MYEHDENEVLRDALSGLNEEVPPMPEGLHAAWMQKVEEDMEDKRIEKTRTRKSITRFLSVAAAMVFVIGGTLLTRDDLGSGMKADQAAYMENGSMKAASYAFGAAYDEAVEEESAMDTGAGVMMTISRSTNAAAEGKELTMQSAMHDLSWYSVAKRNNDNANLLYKIMTEAGMRNIYSEWWHFQDNEVFEKHAYEPLTSGVSWECWVADHNGWRYRRADGSFYANCTQFIDGQGYTFDENGYIGTG